MIDEQHPMQIGMFPMDIKCHTPQQLQQQQQQQQQQQTSMLMGGNERMLTTSTAVTTTTGAGAATTKTTTNGCGGAIAATMAATLETLGVGGGGGGKSGNSPATTTNVNGNCHNHNNNSNNNSINNNSNNNSNSKTNNGHNQQSSPGGPGPPATTSISSRITLGECSLNGGGIGVAPLSLQQQHHHLQLQQQHNHHQQLQQQQQQQLQLHAAHQQLQLHHHHQQHLHPAAMLSNISVSAGGAGSSSSLSLPCGGGGGGEAGPILPLTQCGYCCQAICDRYIMRVVDTSFHEGCLKCSTCSLHLVHSCFARDGKLYCRIDYERLFIRNRCLGCGHKIASDELVMRTLENVFHLKCFACVVCGALLKKGEQYVVKQGQLFCRFDYEKEVEMLQGYDFYGDDLFPPKLDGRRGPKRPRTILNTQQRRAFKASFEVSPKPCRKVRENLAKETGLSLRIVQVWFQNQRAKVKKIQKKAKQDHPKGNSDSQDSQESDSSSLAKIKDEAHSESESLLESPFSSCGAGGGNGGGGGSSSDGVAKLRCIKDENENAPFNCMETNKENCNKTNEPILNTILGLSYATFQQLMGPFTQSPMINPIDRLYSMQNSYFRPEELSYGDCGKDVGEN